MAKALLLISDLPDDQAFGTEVAAQCELPLTIEPDPVKGAALLKGDDDYVILADVSTEKKYQDLESAVQESIGLLSDKINANAVHFLSSEPLERVQYLVDSPLFGHFVIRQYGNVKSAAQHYSRMVRATCAKRAFGLKALLKDPAKIQVVKLASSKQKQDAVEAVKNYLLAVKFQSRMAALIANSVDELLMNAIFDAPVDTIGKALYHSTSRSTEIKLEGQNAVEMHVGFDHDYVGIMAVDLYGSLDRVKLLKHISKVYTEEEYRVRTAAAGAGIGLATVFRSGGSFFFVSENRVRTEVTVFFRRTENFREFRDQFRFLSTQFYF